MSDNEVRVPVCRLTLGSPALPRSNLVSALAQHLVDRYGLSEVSQWHFEVWNEMWFVDP